MRLLAAIAALAFATACTQEPATPPESTPPQLEAPALPQSDGAGNRLEALIQLGTRWCNEDSSWCVEGTAEGVPTRVVSGPNSAALPGGEDEALWPYVIRVGNSALVGVLTRQSQMYSGGGGEAKQLALYEVTGSSARAAGTMPYSGDVMIRACFTEANEEQRAGACQDQYSFVSRLTLDDAVTSGPPRLVLETQAGTYPGRLSRSEDSTEGPDLTAADLVWWIDEGCSFRRVYARDANGAYIANEALPTCEDYLQP